MTSLVLYEWPNKVPGVTDPGDPDIATIVRYGEKVFIFDVDESRGTIDASNIGRILKSFGQAKIYKKNLLAVNHTDAVDLKDRKGKPTLNSLRIKAIADMDQTFAIFFLKQLHALVWKDYSKGVQSTIDFDDGLKMLKIATSALYDLLLASIDDKFSKDLSISEMKNVIDLHNLNNDFTLGRK